jgi:hypothetical protein
MERDVVKEFVRKRIEENKKLFSSNNDGNFAKKVYLIGFKDGIELRSRQ